MRFQVFCLYSLALIALIVFLFVNAPAPLPDSTATNAHFISIEQVFSLLEEESDVVRGTWIQDIVKSGTQSGLKFSTKWRQKSVEAGPLPALFLREIAKNLERSRFRLSLFLGSDFPISSANQFSGYLVQDYWNLHWEQLQQISRFVLMWFVLEQWQLFLLRSQQKMRQANKNLHLHRELGLVAPRFTPIL